MDRKAGVHVTVITLIALYILRSSKKKKLVSQPAHFLLAVASFLLFTLEKKLLKTFFSVLSKTCHSKYYYTLSVHSLCIIQGVGMYVHSTESKIRTMTPCFIPGVLNRWSMDSLGVHGRDSGGP